MTIQITIKVPEYVPSASWAKESPDPQGGQPFLIEGGIVKSGESHTVTIFGNSRLIINEDQGPGH